MLLKENYDINFVYLMEFLVVTPKQEGNIEQQAYKVLQEKKYLIHNEVKQITVSISAINVPKETTSMINIERLLDEKLLEIKSKGKNGLGILGTTELSEVPYGNMDYIKEALEEERLICLYQPICETQTKQIVKYEALVRLIDKDDPKKLISPFHFMKVIKGTSQYIKMSKLVLREVFITLRTYKDVQISINLDLDDLDNNDMMKLITQHLYEHREMANRVTFELLEEHEIQDYDKVMFYVQQLKAYGSKVALDDFGSGYASYKYLIKLDIDILKIDGSIVRELQSAPERAKAVIQSIQQLAEIFQYEVIAEFVSHEDIYEILKELNIQYVQGYYLGEPRPIEAYLGKKD